MAQAKALLISTKLGIWELGFFVLQCLDPLK
jgi:hypothetical protein